MKKTTITLLTILFAFASCEQDSEPACCFNKVAYFGVKKNLTKVQRMKRTEWQVMEDKHEGTAYNAFRPKQRLEFGEEIIS